MMQRHYLGEHFWRGNAMLTLFVARHSRALVGTGLRESSQGGHRYCLHEGDIGRFRTRPDLIVRDADRVTLIIDTKWNRITPRIDDPKQGVSQADVYQLLAYAQLYECPIVVLLYPHHADLASDPIRQQYSIATKEAFETLIVATQDLAGTKSDQKDAIRQMVFECLEGTATPRASVNFFINRADVDFKMRK
jgi:5-methylcytosine-specific restriction enzyme subunit McrC